MNHPQARYLLADWRAGRLPARTATEVATHAGQCDICGPVVETYDLVRDAANATAHLPANRLVELALGASQDPPERQHLEGCTSCRDAMNQVRLAEAARRRPARVARRYARVVAPLAAAAALMFVAFFAGRTSLDSRVEPVGMSLHELPLVRGAQRAWTHETIPAREGRIELALSPAIPHALADTQRLELVWSTGAGRPDHRTRLTAGELRRLSAGSGALLLTLPVGGLDQGSGRLELKSISDGETWLDVPVSWRVSNGGGGGQE